MSCSRCLSLSALLALTFITPVAAMDLTLLSPDNNAILEYKHTHTPVPEPASSLIDMSRSYKTAGICFLGFGDCDSNMLFSSGDSSYERDPADMCREEGFLTTTCALPSYPDNVCAYSELYFKGCKEDKARACKEGGYQSTCNEGYIPDRAQLCPYDGSFYKCVVNPCEGYDYTYDEAMAVGYVVADSCLSGATSRYKRKDNPCSDYQSCECGGEIGTDTCISGTETKYLVCKSCYIPCASGLIDIDNYWCGGAMRCLLR